MHLENIRLLNFKNYAGQGAVFSGEINCLVGNNGSGKTNLLDAIHYLSLTRSAFNLLDQQNIRHGASSFSISGQFRVGDAHYRVLNAYTAGQGKRLELDGQLVERASELVGRFPVVLISPGDQSLVQEGSDLRRRFVDMILSQLDRNYLDTLTQYNRALRQRNTLLKMLQTGQASDRDLLGPYDHLLLRLGDSLHRQRREFCGHFGPTVEAHYRSIAGEQEVVGLTYRSDLAQEDFRERYLRNQVQDLQMQRTVLGVHRDDFRFTIDGHPLRRYGSQGQQKSFVVALKLAQYDVLRREKGFKPVVLLDDIFDKLDDLRIGQLIDRIAHGEFGQVFITDARPERTRHFLRNLKAAIRLFEIKNGEITEGKI